MAFSGPQKIVTSLESEECLDIIQTGDSILSYDTENYTIVDNSVGKIGNEEVDNYIVLVVGEVGTNTNNWDIITSANQNIFTLEDGYKTVEDLQIGDTLKHIDGLNADVKTITRVTLNIVEYSVDSLEKNDNFFINGILFKI